MTENDNKAVNRIEILNWRMHGAEESFCESAVFGADRPDDSITTAVEMGIDPYYDWEQDDTPEDSEDWDHVYYVNDALRFSNTRTPPTQKGASIG